MKFVYAFLSGVAGLADVWPARKVKSPTEGRSDVEALRGDFRRLVDLDVVEILVDVTSDDGILISAGSRGTIVAVYDEGEAYEIEFSKPASTLASVFAHEIRLARR